MGCRILGKIARSRNRDQKNGWFENSVADLFSCETSWLGRCVPASVNMARVIRNVLRFNTGKILRFPQKSANWPIPIWCFTTLVAPVFQQLAENIASILFLPTLQRVPLSRISFFSFSFLFFFFFHPLEQISIPSRMENFCENQIFLRFTVRNVKHLQDIYFPFPSLYF